jgi:parvulin-like peptidyl-prolyl isomerase
MGGLTPLSAQRAEVIDGIAAVVNGDVITISQLRELVGGRERALREAFSGQELIDKVKELRMNALRDLIDRQLILQEFKKREFSIPPYVIEDRVSAIIREEFGGDRAAFVRTLQAQGYTLTRFREIERDKIIVQAMRQANVKDEFIVSPSQIRSFYEQNKALYTTPEQIRLRMIVLREGAEGDYGAFADLPAVGDRKAMAEEIREKLVSGADFDRMAAMYSDDVATRESGGDWGWIERNTLNQELTKVAFSLRPGQISPVLQLGDSYYILLVEARKPASVKPISEVREEIERNLLQKERIQAQERWLDTLRSKAYIKIFS